MKHWFRSAFLDTLPVMAGYLVIGLGFGILAQANGYGFWWVLAMSTLVYAGSMQYVAITLLTGGVSLLTAGLTTLVVNARHLFYGLSMIDRYKGAGKVKPYLIFALTDETYSLVCADKIPEGAPRHRYYLAVSLLNHGYWIVGSVLGVLAGMIIPFNTTGVDFAMTALFLTVLVEQWRATKDHLPAILGGVSSVACLLIVGKENFLIPAMAAIGLLLLLTRKKEVPDRG